MGKRKLLTKKDIKYLKKHPELIPLVIGLSFVLVGMAEIGMGSGLLYSIMGYLLLIVFLLLIFQRYFEKRIHEQKKKQAIFKRKMNNIETIDPWEFEKLIAESLNQVGFKSYATTGSGDKGIDVVATKGSYKIVIQVKKYKGNVGFDAIKEASTGMQLYEANEAWVITSSNKYTKQAIETAEKLKIRLFTWGDFALFLDKQDQKKSKLKGAY